MKKIYACLTGDWVCLNDDPDCRIFDSTPYHWWEEGAKVWSPINRDPSFEHSLYQHNYVEIYYKGIEYRINPVFIQVVTTKD